MTYIKNDNKFYRIYRTEQDQDRIYIYLKHHITSKKDSVFVDRQSVYWDYFLYLMIFETYLQIRLEEKTTASIEPTVHSQKRLPQKSKIENRAKLSLPHYLLGYPLGKKYEELSFNCLWTIFVSENNKKNLITYDWWTWTYGFKLCIHFERYDLPDKTYQSESTRTLFYMHH